MDTKARNNLRNLIIFLNQDWACMFQVKFDLISEYVLVVAGSTDVKMSWLSSALPDISHFLSLKNVSELHKVGQSRDFEALKLRNARSGRRGGV